MELKNFKLFLPTLALSIYTSPGYAECARDDINFYLGKGFTPEQITAICTTSKVKPENKDTINSSDQQDAEKLSAEDKTEIDTNQTTSPKNNEQFLKEAINGRNISLTSEALQYTLKVCLEYGEEDLYGFAPKACPMIEYTIARKDLEIIKAQKKYIFFGDNEIKIKGSIKREIIGGLEKNKTEERELIKEKLETGDLTYIPVRDDVSLSEMEKVLLQLTY